MPNIWPIALEARRREGSFLRYWWQGAAIVVSISMAMLLCEHYGLLYQWEMASLDLFLRHKSNTPSKYVGIVEITDDDYAALFCQKSPLDQNRLKELIRAVAKGEPSVIAIDLDVDRPQEIVQEFQGKPPILWAQVTEPIKEGDKEITLKPKPGALPPDSADLGLALFPLDRDGVVRRYMRWVETSHKMRPTLPWAAFQRSDPATAERNEAKRPGEELIFNFTGDRYGFTITDASSILAPPADCRKPAQARSTPLDFKGKIVLIGGSFAAAHDNYMTPMGERAGVELMAYAIESEERGGGFSEAHPWFSLAFDLLVGNALLAFYFFWRPRYPVSFGVLAGLLLSLAISLVAFASFAYWLSFVPVVFGVIVHELHDELEEAEHLRKENEKLREEISALMRGPAPETPE